MTRTDLLNHLAKKYNLERYLEIGVQNVDKNFNKVKCKIKHGVDPDRTVGRPDADDCYIIHTTSDDFFEAELFREKYDLIFIDGLHTAEQVKKDFENSLKVLSPNGFIVLHDCNPLKEEHTIVPRPRPTGHWNGDVYKFACSMPKSPFWTVDIDNGCMVIKPEKDLFNDGIEWPQYINWRTFDTHRKELLNLISWEDFLKL
jgi:hypothetical protein